MIDYEQITLRARQVAGQVLVEKEALVDADVRVVEWGARRLAVQIVSKVLSHDISSKQQTVTVSATYYVSPWQRYKAERCAPWVARRLPPRRETVSETATVTFEEALTFPLNTMRYPDHLGAPVVIQSISPPYYEHHER